MRTNPTKPLIFLIVFPILLSVGANTVYAAEGIRAEVVKCKEKKISKTELRKIRKVKKAINEKIKSGQVETTTSCDDSWVVDLIIILLRQFPVLGVIVLIVALIIAACG